MKPENQQLNSLVHAVKFYVFCIFIGRDILKIMIVVYTFAKGTIYFKGFTVKVIFFKKLEKKLMPYHFLGDVKYYFKWKVFFLCDNGISLRVSTNTKCAVGQNKQNIIVKLVNTFCM